ncbi:MAG: hypothetical protein KC431_05605, partial [Myxococcales bacterium]|nr:hypothetical protein [Myxococcales bacterium]
AFADDETVESCGFEPAEAGLECEYDYTRHHPLAVVTSESGDVRLLWSRIHHTGTMVSLCQMGGPMFCYWTPQADSSTGALWIGWPEGDSVSGVEVAASFAMSGTAAVDSSGSIHLAVYDLPPGAEGSTVRYLRLAPQ